jgi:hypothetical protein
MCGMYYYYYYYYYYIVRIYKNNPGIGIQFPADSRMLILQ